MLSPRRCQARATKRMSVRLQRQLDTAQQHEAELADALQRSTSIGERAYTDVIAMTLERRFTSR